MDNSTSLNGMFQNQNLTLLSIATNKGYRIYETYNFLQVSDDDDYQELIGPLKNVQLLYESNIIIFVGTKDNTNFPENQIIVWDEIKKRKIGILMMKETIIDIKVSKTTIFAVLRNKIVVFDIINLKYLFTINNVNSKPNLITMINFGELTTLVYTSTTTPEEIKVLKCMINVEIVYSSKEGEVKERLDKSIYCFIKSKNRIVLSKKGDLIAVISKGGSNIHVYSLTQYQLLYCLWRGNVEEDILDIAFSKKNKFICLVNSKNTVHIYALDPSDQNIIICKCHEVDDSEKIDKQGSLFNSVLFKNIFSSIKPINSYAKYKLNNEETYNYNSILEDKMNSVMIFFERVNELIIINSKGIIEKIKFNTKEGGYCWNYKTINWLSPNRRHGATD